MKTILFAACCVALLSFAVGQSYIAAPVIGYQQGVSLSITPPQTTNQQCQVYGVPTPYGYAEQMSSPLYLYTPQGTGLHTLDFYYSDSYYLVPVVAPGNAILQLDNSNPNDPAITLDSGRTANGQSGAVYVYLISKANNGIVCFSQIQLTVTPALTCLPGYGGVYQTGSGSTSASLPQGAGTFVTPSNGQIFVVNQFLTTNVQNIIQTTVVNQFTTINNNIQVNRITNNIVTIQNNTNIINRITAMAPAPMPINCTLMPTNPTCARTAMTPGLRVAPMGSPLGAAPRTNAPVTAPMTGAVTPARATTPTMGGATPPTTSTLGGTPPMMGVQGPTGTSSSG